MIILRDILYGGLIGISFLIPGVSGGTMMILLGVFDDAIHSINELLHGRFYKIKQMFWMVVGVCLSLILFSSLIVHLLKSYESYTLIFFLGIVIYGLWIVYQETGIKRINKKDIGYGVIGILIVIALSFYNGTLIDFEQTSSLSMHIGLMILGIPLAVALILPGISTSLLLLSFGLYKTTLEALASFDGGILIPLGIGIIIGTILLTRFLEQQLKHHRRRTYVIIIGFVIGSLVEIIKLLWVAQWPSWIGVLFYFMLGLAFMSIIQGGFKR